MKALVALTIIAASTESVLGAELQVQKIPDNMIEKGFALEVVFAAERVDYMTTSVSSTKIRGFRDRKTCWDHAAKIGNAISEAAKDTTDRGRMSFNCHEEEDFRKFQEPPH